MNEVHTFDLYAMQEALQEAQRAFDEDEVPIGAVITQQEKIIARAHNQTRWALTTLLVVHCT